MSDQLWELLETETGQSPVGDLYSWSLNYDSGKGPFTLFLDLIGWSEDEIGEPLYSLADASLGYVELSKLAEALTQYAEDPTATMGVVTALMDAEMAE